jgi:hypothetical protein
MNKFLLGCYSVGWYGSEKLPKLCDIFTTFTRYYTLGTDRLQNKDTDFKARLRTRKLAPSNNRADDILLLTLVNFMSYPALRPTGLPLLMSSSLAAFWSKLIWPSPSWVYLALNLGTDLTCLNVSASMYNGADDLIYILATWRCG